MSAGTVVNPKRVRTQANERLDDVDAEALSVGAREHLDAYSRAVEATPRNVGSSTPTGLIFQGFGMTLNPTAPTDNKIRVQSALGVALDSDGRLLIKESGVQVDLTLAAGNTQLYAYFVETDDDVAVRRRISVTAPFTESGPTQATKFKASTGFFTRAGDQTSIVASDVVNGATTALCFLGVAINTAGTITMTGYDATNAPNGAFATNRITTIASVPTLPAVPTHNGSGKTILELVTTVSYVLGQAIWKSSAGLTPSAANNFGAFTLPTKGISSLVEYLAAGNLAGNHMIAGTLSVQGLITAQDGVTASAAKHFTVSGGGKYKHDTITENIPLIYGTVAVANPAVSVLIQPSTGNLQLPVRLPVGKRVTAIRAKLQDASGTTVTLHIQSKAMAALTPPTWNSIGSTSSAADATVQLLTVSVAVDIVAFTEYCVLLAPSGTDSICSVYIAEIDYSAL